MQLFLEAAPRFFFYNNAEFYSSSPFAGQPGYS